MDFINGEPMDLSDGRIETKDLGDGKHQLIIKKAKMEDNEAVTAKTPPTRVTRCWRASSNFRHQGRGVPLRLRPVNGVAKKQCGCSIPYKVEGEKQSGEIIVET